MSLLMKAMLRTTMVMLILLMMISVGLAHDLAEGFLRDPYYNYSIGCWGILTIVIAPYRS